MFLVSWPCVSTATDGCSKFARDGSDGIRNLYLSVEIHEESNDHICAASKLSLLARARIDALIDEGFPSPVNAAP